MAKTCPECGATNSDELGSYRACGQGLNRAGGRARPPTRGDEGQGRSSGPWIATTLIAILLLCCLSLIGVALLDELLPSHPLQAMILGAPPLTDAQPSATTTPAHTATPPLPTPGPARDSFEPDDSPAQASPIEVGGVRQAHTLSPAGDRDYVAFQVAAGMRYTVETGGLGTQCDTVLTLYDEDGTELAQDDDSGDEPLASRITWTAEEDGTLFAEVTQFDQEAEGEHAGYEIWVSESEPPILEEDEYEPDDSMEQANEILLGTPQAHGIHRPEDRDWVFFEAEEGKTYLIETSRLHGGMDTIIFLHDDAGEKLAENDDSGTEDLASRITWMARSSGRLYVAVQDYSGYEVSPEMGYTISVSEGLPYQADAYEPDDTQDQARTIEVGSYQNHNLHVTADHDWTFFQGEAGIEYVVETFHLGGRIDTLLSLYDAQGRPLDSDDDSGSEPLASRLSYEPEEDGIIYVMVQDLGDREAGPGTEYSISVREQGTVLSAGDRYEPDDGPDQASEIQIGEVQRHTIHVPGDHDWLSLRVEAGVTYVVETRNLGEEMDTILFLYDASGVELARDDDGGDEPFASRLTWTAEQTGTLYLMVRHYKDDRAGRTMSYDVAVHEAGTEIASALPGVYLADGAYHIVTLETNRFVVGVSDLLFLGNFVLQVDAQQVSGDNDNEYGLVYGYQDDDNFYEVAISGDGYVGFFAKQRGRWETISAFRESEAINQGNAVNLLRLEVKAGALQLYVNGELALRGFDTRLSEGLIGFGCGAFGQPFLHCSFDNLRVWDQEGSLVWQDGFDDNSGEWYQSPAR